VSFENWKRRLAGEKITAYLQPQLEDEGYYRRPITEKVIGANGHRNGQNRIVGWEPVAYFIDGGKLCGVIGDRDMAENEVGDETLWSYVCRHPITEAVYRAVAERGEPWPDASPAAAFNKDMAKPALTPDQVLDKAMGADADDHQKLETELSAAFGHNSNAEPKVEPHIEHAEAIKNAISAAKDMEVKDEASAAVVLGMKNRIAELRLSATKTGKAIYAPIYQQYKTIMGQWTPMIESAENWEKVLDKRYLTWRAAEKKKADESARAAAEAQRLIDEANQRAADRAIAQGIPEPAPEVPEVSPAPTPAPAPVAPTYRAAGQRTAPKEVERWHLDGIDDYDAVYAVFKSNADVQAALLKAATAAVKNGQEVPGTRRHFGLI
jgi:hypothetical protein